MMIVDDGLFLFLMDFYGGGRPCEQDLYDLGRRAADLAKNFKFR